MGARCGLFEIMSNLEIMVILSFFGDGENDLYGDRGGHWRHRQVIMIV